MRTIITLLAFVVLLNLASLGFLYKQDTMKQELVKQTTAIIALSDNLKQVNSNNASIIENLKTIIANQKTYPLKETYNVPIYQSQSKNEERQKLPVPVPHSETPGTLPSLNWLDNLSPEKKAEVDQAFADLANEFPPLEDINQQDPEDLKQRMIEEQNALKNKMKQILSRDDYRTFEKSLPVF